MEIRRGIKPRSESSLPPPRHRHRHPSAAPLLAWLLVIYRAGSAPARRALLGLGPRSTINNPQIMFLLFQYIVFKTPQHGEASQGHDTRSRARWLCGARYPLLSLSLSRCCVFETWRSSQRDFSLSPSPIDVLLACSSGLCDLVKLLAKYLDQGGSNFACGANYPHQALKGGYFVFVWRVGT